MSACLTLITCLDVGGRFNSSLIVSCIIFLLEHKQEGAN